MRRLQSLDEIADLYSRWGNHSYDEDVTQITHAVQCARLAQDARAKRRMPLAALLHDIGHLIALDDIGPDGDHFGGDLEHEKVGSVALGDLFDSEVTGPIALHVAAKRFLCATEPTYTAELSDASLHSLRLQGGPMSADEVRRYKMLPYWSEAVHLRRWDEAAKNTGLGPFTVDDFCEVLLATTN